MLVCKPLPSATDAALNFIEHQQPALAVADLTQVRKIAVVGDIDAALTLNRFHQYSDHVLVVGGDRGKRIPVVVGHPGKAGQQRLETRLNLPASRCGQGCDRAAVKSLLHHDHGRILDSLIVAEEASNLDGRFVGFASRIAEKCGVHRRKVA